MRLHGMIFITAAIYAVWTPAYFLLAPPMRVAPKGEIVEPILITGDLDDTGRVTRRGFGYRIRTEAEDPRPVMLFEGLFALPASHYEFAPFNPKNRWREVTFTSSDGSDPRRNGHGYYAVIGPAAN